MIIKLAVRVKLSPFANSADNKFQYPLLVKFIKTQVIVEQYECPSLQLNFVVGRSLLFKNFLWPRQNFQNSIPLQKGLISSVNFS